MNGRGDQYRGLCRALNAGIDENRNHALSTPSRFRHPRFNTVSVLPVWSASTGFGPGVASLSAAPSCPGPCCSRPSPERQGVRQEPTSCQTITICRCARYQGRLSRKMAQQESVKHPCRPWISRSTSAGCPGSGLLDGPWQADGGAAPASCGPTPVAA
jgi:hypothetical protein